MGFTKFGGLGLTLNQAKILWVEAGRKTRSSFISGLRKKKYIVETASTGKAALKKLPTVSPDVIVVNAASFRSSGKRICQSVRSSENYLPILLIANPEYPVIEDDVVNVVLNLPFTIRKLTNRINILLPGESDKVIKAGPISLDLIRRQVRCEDRESQLTPRLLSLLRMLIEQPGVVFEREKLFKEIWNTEYTGDTRTLDVHISWLRAALEEDPRKPKYLKTIRGVGYRLDVPV